MDRKFKQITDNIHETIYISMLESEMMSTAYFYRLNDIYQSSTVYMTYPSNRTKRYEHSIGVMELSSSMLFSAVSNADKDTRNELFKQLTRQFEVLTKALFKNSNKISAQYYTPCRSEIAKLIVAIKADRKERLHNNADVNNVRDMVDEILMEAVSSNVLAESALDSFQFYPVGSQKSNSPKDRVDHGATDLFLYRCLLQAVRIVALFHDVGHPPYSHIMEDVLMDLYRNCHEILEEDPGNEQAEGFIDVMAPYISEEQANSCQMITTDLKFSNPHLHERIGLSLLQSTINDVLPDMLRETIAQDIPVQHKVAKILYLVTSVEFAMSILVEKNIFFHSFHTIVDGVLDADRFDYIVRDSYNSGVDGGKIPYKRIINSAKLVFLEKWDDRKLQYSERPFVIVYPQKLKDDICDLLVTRYKIFARINFHHKCMKTAVVLQSAVKELAMDYIQPKNQRAVCPNIEMLWQALGLDIGERMERIIQWNDSRLISVLHEALVTLKTEKPFYNDSAYDNLRCDLEEVLLGRKSYFSLIKRAGDCLAFVNKVFAEAGLTDALLEQYQAEELKKYYSEKGSTDGETGFDPGPEERMEMLAAPMVRAEDSYRRIRNLRWVKKTGDWEILNNCTPLEDRCIADKMRDVLDGLVADETIVSYKLIVNYGRGKTGLPSHETPLDEIYFMGSDNKPVVFNDSLSLPLETEIKSIERGVPWIFIYFVPPKDGKKPRELWEIIFDALAKAVGESLHIRTRDELFYKSLS